MREDDLPPAWLRRREPRLESAADNPLFRLVIFRRHLHDRLRISIAGYLLFGLLGAIIASVGALTWPMLAWFIVAWCVLSMEMSDRPGWVARRGGGLGGLTSLPQWAAEDLDQAAFDKESMALALWATTLSRSLISLWGGLFLVGMGTCWGRILGIALGGGPLFIDWIWVVPLTYLTLRLVLHLASPYHTLPHCISLLEMAKLNWWRRHHPLRYLMQTAVALLRHVVMFGVLLALGALIGMQFAHFYQTLPFDPHRPCNLVVGGFVGMALGLMLGAIRSFWVASRSDRYLARMSELIGWLLEEHRTERDGEDVRVARKASPSAEGAKTISRRSESPGSA